MADSTALNLPDIDEIKRLSQSLAMLDAILCPDPDSRYYRFELRDGLSVASMSNGSGDEYAIVFADQGAVIKGFAHESAMSPYENDPPAVARGMFEGLPVQLERALPDAGLEVDVTTFCLWREYGQESWNRGPVEFAEGEDPDGSKELLEILKGDPQTFQEFAEYYYEVPVDLAVVSRFYEWNPLSEEFVRTLSPDRDFKEARDEALSIGYPVA